MAHSRSARRGQATLRNAVATQGWCVDCERHRKLRGGAQEFGRVLLQVTRGSLRPLRHPAFRLALAGVGGTALIYALVTSWGDLSTVHWEFRPLPIAFALVCLLFVTI